ncbi:16225_t:CDS:2, partial [Gigaspora margarita]
KILSKILTKEFKHQVKFILSGNEALNLLSQDIYDLVFMDIDMPELSGIETSIKIRNSKIVMEKNKVIPILAYTTNEWKEEFLNAGMVNVSFSSFDKIQAVIETVSLC